MLKFLFMHHLFENLRDLLFHTETSRKRTNDTPTVRVLLIDPITKEAVTLGHELRAAVAQGQFLHAEARITRSELLDLLCDKLMMSKTIATYQVFSVCNTHCKCL